ncbi:MULTISPECIES: 23S rRNA (adenine(2503)-C(2))-methyltransferase RlmN [Calditerrivibrio]|uniref:23S rRNA (adenine(2503)-C(2))-methyltransferase RlmN n=1 Tax=Calditerrivibrio TaxID=545865 RepID=UPI003C78A81B
MIKVDAMTLEELKEFMVVQGEKSFRGEQVYKWIFQKGVKDFSHMTDLSVELRRKLQNTASFTYLKPIEIKRDEYDGSQKFLFELEDKNKIESVALKDQDRITLCVSTQVGCRMGCAFCATAKIGFIRDLTAGEIVRQVIEVNEHLATNSEKVTNIVFMGMGEPLDNYHNVVKAIEIITDEMGLGYSHRKVTVSTSGVIDRIDELFKLKKQVNLAVSLNATTDDIRSAIMPINKKFNIEKLMKKLKSLPIQKRKRITIEYVMIKGVNDTLDDAKRLVRLLNGLPIKLNLIVYNDGGNENYHAPDEQTVLSFQKYLLDKHITAFIRKSLGKNIEGACGQLYAKYNKGVQYGY